MKANISVLISESDLQSKIDEMGATIKKDYEGKEVVIIGILRGSIMFMADLAKKLDPETTEFEFVEVSSYGAETTSSGVVKINKDVSSSITGKHVLVVEDIIDTGHTLAAIIEHLERKKPASLQICTLLDKPERREVQKIKVDYTGFFIPNKFVVGYGLDYNQKYRNLGYIGIIE